MQAEAEAEAVVQRMPSLFVERAALPNNSNDKEEYVVKAQGDRCGHLCNDLRGSRLFILATVLERSSRCTTTYVHDQIDTQSIRASSWCSTSWITGSCTSATAACSYATDEVFTKYDLNKYQDKL